MKKHIDIGITYPSYFPDEFEKEFIDDLRHENLNLVIRKEDPRAQSRISANFVSKDHRQLYYSFSCISYLNVQK